MGRLRLTIYDDGRASLSSRMVSIGYYTEGDSHVLSTNPDLYGLGETQFEARTEFEKVLKEYIHDLQIFLENIYREDPIIVDHTNRVIEDWNGRAWGYGEPPKIIDCEDSPDDTDEFQVCEFEEDDECEF